MENSDEIILTPLQKALQSLEKALQQPKDEYTRDAVIQRFEYSYELSWKLLKRYLAKYVGIEEHLLKNIFRAAGKAKLVGNVDDWFRFHQARNLTLHTYNELTAEEVYRIAKDFLPSAKQLLKTLEKSLHDTSETK